MDAEEIRELQQLWFIGSAYLKLAEGLKDINELYSAVWKSFISCPNNEKTLYTMLLSAHLTSSAGRFASLEERLVGGERKLRRLAYPYVSGKFTGIFPARYIHVHLRDSISHMEPKGKAINKDERDEWKQRQD